MFRGTRTEVEDSLTLLKLTKAEDKTERNTEACSHDNCCGGKAINIQYLCVCVCERERERASVLVDARFLGRVHACSLAYPACNAYAPYCDVCCGPSGFTTYSARFSEKVTEYNKCVLIYLKSFLF